MAKSLSELQRFILRRAAENGGQLRYAEIIRKFYRLPRSAFVELRIVRAAISRSVRALVRRRLAVVVHDYIRPTALTWVHGAGCVSIKLTPAGLGAAGRIPPSRTLPRAKAITPIASSILVSGRLVERVGRLIGSLDDERTLDHLTTKEGEQAQKADRRQHSAAERRDARGRRPRKSRKPLTYKGYST